MTERGMTGFAARSEYTVDLAISAATFDADLIADLREHFLPRLRTPSIWAGHAESLTVEGRGALVADASRVAVVLHHRLWRDNTPAKDDESALRERLQQRPGSVCVLTLDETQVPEWLATAPRCDLAENGVELAATFALDAVASCGGSLRATTPRVDVAEPRTRWPEGPAPLLLQTRAQTMLRREFDAIAGELKTYVGSRSSAQPDGIFELHTLPYRLIARLGDQAISVSWIAGRMPTVHDGRLLVIEWMNVAAETRGIAALKSAQANREQVYLAEATSADDWRWRMDQPNGRAYTTSHLVAEWLASASIEVR